MRADVFRFAGHKRKWSCLNGMSILPPGADFVSQIGGVREKCHEGTLEHECVSANFAYDRSALKFGSSERNDRIVIPSCSTNGTRKLSSVITLDPADVALLHFSGHGTINNLDGYSVTQDAKKYDDGVAMSDVLKLANDSKVAEVVLLLDCCFSGNLGNVPAVDNSKSLLRESVSILAAGRGDQPSVETGGGGVFTSLVVDALEGGAANLPGAVSAPAIYAFVEAALGAWDRRSAFSYPNAADSSTALHSSMRAQDHCVIISIDGSNHRFDGGIERSSVSKDSQHNSCLSLDVPDVGADRMLSIEDMAWNSQRTLVSATVGRTLGQSQGAGRQVRTRGCGLWNDLKPSPLQRHFWVRNAPYALRDPGNPLKPQQMRAPSERTKGHKPLMRKIFSRFSSHIVTLSYSQGMLLLRSAQLSTA
jgi:hypothetical protein